MFGKRPGARRIKSLDPYDKIVSYIMTRRSDALVYFADTIDCEPLDNYIKKIYEEKGVTLSYLDLVNAATVRIYAQMPALNRYVMNGYMYANDNISISMAVKKSLRDGSTSTTIKVPFTGHENLFEIHNAFHAEIVKNKEATEENGTDKMMAKFMNLPSFIIMPVISFVKWLDKIGCMPKAIIDISPFHSSVFITYLKSLGLRSVYHHIYDFGTVGMFLCVGKEQLLAVPDKKTGEIQSRKMIELQVVVDERICDGYYHAKAMKLFKRILEHPEALEERLEKVEKDID